VLLPSGIAGEGVSHIVNLEAGKIWKTHMLSNRDGVEWRSGAELHERIVKPLNIVKCSVVDHRLTRAIV
jgi:hypothetical protein